MQDVAMDVPLVEVHEDEHYRDGGQLEGSRTVEQRDRGGDQPEPDEGREGEMTPRAVPPRDRRQGFGAHPIPLRERLGDFVRAGVDALRCHVSILGHAPRGPQAHSTTPPDGPAASVGSSSSASSTVTENVPLLARNVGGLLPTSSRRTVWPALNS